MPDLGIVVPVLGDSITETITSVLNSLLLRVTNSFNESSIDEEIGNMGSYDKSTFLKLIMDTYKINYDCKLTDTEWNSIVNAAKQLTEDTKQQYKYIYHMLRLYCANGYVNSGDEIKDNDSVRIEYNIDLPALTGIHIKNLDSLFWSSNGITVNITFVVPYEFNYADICKKLVKITKNDVIVNYYEFRDRHYDTIHNTTIKSDANDNGKLSVHICVAPDNVKDVTYELYEYMGLKYAVGICQYVTVVNAYNNAIVPIHDMAEIIGSKSDRYKYKSADKDDFDKFIIKSSILCHIDYDEIDNAYYFREPEIISDIVITRLHNDVLEHDLQKTKNKHLPKVDKDAKLGVIVPVETKDNIIPIVLAMICNVNLQMPNGMKDELNKLLNESTCFVVLDAIASEFEIPIQSEYANICRNLYRYCKEHKLDYIDRLQLIVQYEYIKQVVEKYSEDEEKYVELLEKYKKLEQKIEQFSEYERRYTILLNRYEHIKQAVEILNSRYEKQYGNLFNECENIKQDVKILNSID